MIGIPMYTTILTLYKQGVSQRQISKITNTHRKTVRRIILKYKDSKIETPAPYKRKSFIDSWHKQIIELMTHRLSTVRIYEKLQDQGFKASYSALTRHIRKHNIKQNTCIRFHSNAGEEAQVDFGDVGKQFDCNGKLRKAYIFNNILPRLCSINGAISIIGTLFRYLKHSFKRSLRYFRLT